VRIRFDTKRLGVPAEVFATVISSLALAATLINAWSSYNSLRISRQAEQAGLFTQFQEEYNAVSARFPPRLLDPTFQPARGSDDYRRLEEYWIFCYAEWFATHDLNGGTYGNLWTHYYATLVLNALDIPSLRYVVIDMMTLPDAHRGAYPTFYGDLSVLAGAAGKPLRQVTKD